MVTKVLSVGGSIIAPQEPDVHFLAQFVAMVRQWLSESDERRLILVAGGGAPARTYQNAYRSIAGGAFDSAAADWIGVMATRLNAELLRAAVGDLCLDPVVTNPTEAKEFSARVLVAAGWKPGFSSDNDAVLLAEKFGADTVVNLSNIEKVCTDDPRTNPAARPLDTVSWPDFRKMVGDEWTPGKNTPFDPVASRKAEALGLKVICAGGRNIQNIRAILDGREFVGTSIG